MSAIHECRHEDGKGHDCNCPISHEHNFDQYKEWEQAQFGISRIVDELIEKRADQIRRGYSPEHDQEAGVTHLLGEASLRMGQMFQANWFTRDDIITIAALLVAGVEVLDHAGGS